MNDSSEEPRKIIIDEDWKSQIESEKEQLRQQEIEPGSDADADGDGDGQNPAEELPPASFAAHIMTLATQATVGLGQIPDPEKPNEPPPVNLPFAKYMIDTLVILEEKTSGNLTTEEAAMMENITHQLQMAYVEVSRQVGG